MPRYPFRYPFILRSLSTRCPAAIPPLSSRCPADKRLLYRDTLPLGGATGAGTKRWCSPRALEAAAVLMRADGDCEEYCSEEKLRLACT